jgi:hypothetical protein
VVGTQWYNILFFVPWFKRGKLLRGIAQIGVIVCVFRFEQQQW